MLELRRLNAGYGRAQVLFDLELELRAGEVAVLAGRNGGGKSTTLKTIMGLVTASSGEVIFQGRRIDSLQPFEVARLGLGYVPEDRRIFTDLTVAENLEVGRRPSRPGLPPWTMERMFALFPNLAGMRARPGSRMSGGEQKMLAIARTLMGNPAAILLDEPSEGLAPVIVRQMAEAVRSLKGAGLSVLLCEQNPRFAGDVADRVYRIEKGRILPG
ncbi:MAG: transporter ATP-binding protein [Burkholderiales bacterium]|nr:transporter ATP-binding protein [Burkholderiales bacterium]